MFAVQKRRYRSLILPSRLACSRSRQPNPLAAVGSWSTDWPLWRRQTHHLAVYEAGPSTLFAAGRGGLFRSLSAGTAWQRIEVGLPDALYVQAMATSTVAPVLYLTDFDEVVPHRQWRRSLGADQYAAAFRELHLRRQPASRHQQQHCHSDVQRRLRIDQCRQHLDRSRRNRQPAPLSARSCLPPTARSIWACSTPTQALLAERRC